MSFDLRIDSTTWDLPEVTSFISGPELTVQRAKIRLQTFHSEWILDQFVGLPFVEWRETKPPDLAAIQAVVLAELVSTPGVLRVESIEASFDPNTRAVSIEGDVIIEDEDPVDELTAALAFIFGANTTPVVIMHLSSGPIARV